MKTDELVNYERGGNKIILFSNVKEFGGEWKVKRELTPSIWILFRGKLGDRLDYWSEYRCWLAVKIVSPTKLKILDNHQRGYGWFWAYTEQMTYREWLEKVKEKHIKDKRKEV